MVTVGRFDPVGQRLDELADAETIERVRTLAGPAPGRADAYWRCLAGWRDWSIWPVESGLQVVPPSGSSSSHVAGDVDVDGVPTAGRDVGWIHRWEATE